ESALSRPRFRTGCTGSTENRLRRPAEPVCRQALSDFDEVVVQLIDVAFGDREMLGEHRADCFDRLAEPVGGARDASAQRALRSPRCASDSVVRRILVDVASTRRCETEVEEE